MSIRQVASSVFRVRHVARLKESATSCDRDARVIVGCRPFPDVAAEVMYTIWAIRSGMRADFVWSECRGNLAIGEVVIGFVRLKLLAVGKCSAICAACGPLPFTFVAGTCIRDPAAVMQPGRVREHVGERYSGDREAGPVLDRSSVSAAVANGLALSCHSTVFVASQRDLVPVVGELAERDGEP